MNRTKIVNGERVVLTDEQQAAVEQQEIKDLAKWQATRYQDQRRREYPKMMQQLDLLWHDINSGNLPGKDTSVWFQRIAATKAKYPKPAE